MGTKQRWLAGIAMGLLIGTTGCESASNAAGDDDKNADGGGNGGGNGGETNNGGNGTDNNGGNTGATSDAGNEPPPDLNYIPANEGKCDLDSQPELSAIAKKTLTDIVSYKAQKAADLELCPTTASDRACAPCASNPFLAWVTAVDAADTGGVEGSGNRMALADYFRRALQYPFRELLVLDAEGDDSGLLLAQGRAKCTEAGECTTFELQAESAEANCTSITHNLSVASKTTMGDVTTVVTKEGTNAFGFLVPLAPALPTYPLANATVVSDSIPNACPTAVQVTNDEEFHSFLACNPTLTMLMTTPKMTNVIDPDGVSCFQLSGLLDVTSLPAAARALVDTITYEELDYPGFIRINLSARLVDSTISVDSSLTEEVL